MYVLVFYGGSSSGCDLEGVGDCSCIWGPVVFNPEAYYVCCRLRYCLYFICIFFYAVHVEHFPCMLLVTSYSGMYEIGNSAL